MSARLIRVGLVLAGGQSRRMGQDKAQMQFRGERLIDRALDRLGGQVDVVMLNTPKKPTDLNSQIRHVPDHIGGFQGPLAGVHAALKALHSARLDNWALYTIPVDCPFVPLDLVERLDQCPQPVAFAASEGQRHPVCARWPAHAMPIIEAALLNGQRKIDRVAAEIGFGEVTWELLTHSNGQTLDPFVNVNTLEEFEAAKKAAGNIRGVQTRS